VNTQSGSNARGSAGAFQSSTGAQGAGYSGSNGNRGGAVKTQNGDVYAGHDGNAYQHTSDGWSQWNKGGWQPVNPASSSSNRQQTATNTAATQTPSQTTRNQATQNQPAHSQSWQSQSAGAGQRFSRQSMDSASYNQLEQDRQARSAGSGRFRGYGGGRLDGEGGGRFGGGGGGRFRR
jgi:hypothetical protein